MNDFQAFPAPAKLNLFLHITGRRADGYHLLQSVFRFVDYGDTLHLKITQDGRIRRITDIPDIPEAHDLCVRAARLLQQHSLSPLGVEIKLEKRLPMGGGLGGGSSDAATMLLALNRLWSLNLPRAALQTLALQLGADVPVFVFGRSAWAEGIGEDLHPIPLTPAWYIVLVPDAHVATAQVFASGELTRDTNPAKMAAFFKGYGRNDLEPVVCQQYPAVAAALEWLRQFGDGRMSGSGACVFMECENEAEAERIFSLKPGHIGGFVAAGLDHHPLSGYAD